MSLQVQCQCSAKPTDALPSFCQTSICETKVQMSIITISIDLHVVLSLQCTEVMFADYHQTSELYHVRKGANMKQKGP